MAITTQFLTGFEHGFIGAGANNGGGLFDAAPGSGWSASTSSPRNGAYCAHLVAPANTATRLVKNITGAPTKIVGRVAVKVAASGTYQIINSTDASAGTPFDISLSSGQFLATFGGQSISGGAYTPGQWHLIEFRIDVTAKTFDWKIDTVSKTRVIATTVNAPIDIGLGTKKTADATFTADYDDFIFGIWAFPQDWYGDGKVLGQLAGLDGTHATIASLSPGDAGTAYSGTPTTVNTMVDDPPATGGWTATRSATDNIALRVATVGAYAEIKPSVTAETGTPNAVRAIMSYSSSTTTANLAACDVRNSEGTVTELWGLTGGVGKAYNIVGNQFKAGIVARPSAGWTAAEINAIRLRFGGCTSVDINPVPTVQAMMLEVDWAVFPVAASSPADETVIDDFNRADGPIYSGAGGSIWESVGRENNNTTPSVVTTINNQMGTPSLPAWARSKIKLQSDFDLLIDIAAVTPSGFGIYFAMTDIGTPTWDGYLLSLLSLTTWSILYSLEGTTSTLTTVANAPPPVVGSTIWIAKRGSTISVYYRATSGGQFLQILNTVDARNNVASEFIFDVQNIAWRLDNLRGGPLVSTGTTYNDTGSGNISESGSSIEDYSHDASLSGTVTASGSGIESYSVPADYTDSAFGTITSSGTGTDNRIGEDIAVGTSTVSGNGVDSSIGNDSRSGTITASGVGTESYSYADSSFGMETSSGSGIESYQVAYIDIASGTVIVSGIGTESYSYADIGSGTVIASGTGIESYSYSDSRSGTIATTGSGLEQVAYVDSGSGTVTVSGTRTEFYSYIDSGSGTGTISGSGVESYQLAYADSGSGTVTVSGNSVEQILYADSGSGTITASGIRSESYSCTDIGSGTVTASGSGIENYQVVYIDSGSGTVAVSGGGVESYQVASTYIDSGSGTVAVSGSGIESYQATYADIASGTVVVNGNGTESYSSIDSGLGTIASSGTRIESYSYVDSGSGTINASGTGSDARVYVDTNTGTIAATGTGSDNRVYADTNTGTIAASGTSTETASHSVSSVGTVVISGTGIDNRVYDDAVSGTISVSGTGVDSSEILIGYIDANSGQITASGTSVEAQAHTSTAIGSVVAYGTSVESQLRSRTSTGSSSVSGTGVESQSHSSTSTGFGFVDGTGSESYEVRYDIIYTDIAAGTITSTGTGNDSISHSSTAIGTVQSTGTSSDSITYSNTSTGTITWFGSGVENTEYEDTSSGIIVLTGGFHEDTGYKSVQLIPFSTITALNQVKTEVLNQMPIQSKITNTTPVAVQIVLRSQIKVNAAKRNRTKVQMTNR